MEHGAWSMKHGARSMEHGARSMEHGKMFKKISLINLINLNRDFLWIPLSHSHSIGKPVNR